MTTEAQAKQRALAWKIKLLNGAQHNVCKTDILLPADITRELVSLRSQLIRVELLVRAHLAQGVSK